MTALGDMLNKDDKVDAWFAETVLNPIGKGEFTSATLAADNDITETIARRMINKGLAKGTLEEAGLRRAPSGKPAMAYRVK